MTIAFTDSVPPNICILMCTFNGERFLAEQLQSIENQTHSNWRVIMSDDGSSDNTLMVAKQFQEKWGQDKLEIRQGPKKGFCQNFLSMACDASVRSELYAFSDQDDVWMADKLSRAVVYFEGNNQSQRPIAYGSRTQIVDEDLKTLGFSPNFSLPRSFRNALVQSIAGGNTQVFNHSTKLLLESAGMLKVVSHDWWLYQIVQGAGGVFHFDSKPTLLYRQHSYSIVGANSSIRAKVDRLLFVFNGRFKFWNDINFAALYKARELLDKDSQEVLNIFGKFRGASIKDRIRLLGVCGLYRQTWQGTLSLWIATLANKI